MTARGCHGFHGEKIIFNWARLSRETEVEISSEGELLAFEWLMFGHGDHGKQILGGKLSNPWRVISLFVK